MTKSESPSASPLDEIVRITSRLKSSGRFAARRTSSAKDMHLRVDGVGPLRLPLTQNQARQLVAIGRPARFGLGEKTVLDLKVRNCTEIPVGRVHLDHRQFQRTLGPVLHSLRADLGLDAAAHLKAELQSMLVYGPGQFFTRHKDSEKEDAMLASLVVTLPSSFAGGALTIEHQGDKLACRGTKGSLSFVAFFADCEHAVLPVTSGYRVALTYNLAIARANTRSIVAVPRVSQALVPELERYFGTVRKPRYSWQQERSTTPEQLFFLLDHEYTERGLSWAHLKGNDAPRAAVLRDAAEAAGCEATLALAELHETWDAFEGGDDGGWRRGRYDYDEDDEDLDDDSDSGGDDCELGDLIDSDTTIDRWLDPDTGTLEKIHRRVPGDAIAFATPNSDLSPLRSEYEGYMGNYGNTLDRWYRRAGVLVWRRERGLALRASLSPGWMLRKAKECLAATNVNEAARLVEAVLSNWGEMVARDESHRLLKVALKLAQKVASPELATSLMAPFCLEKLATSDAADMAALLGHYGEPWWRALLATWTKETSYSDTHESPEAWAAARLAGLAAALTEVGAGHGARLARLIVENRWHWLEQLLEGDGGGQRPSAWRKSLVSLARPFVGLIQAVEVARATDIGSTITETFCRPEQAGLLQLTLEALKLARSQSRDGYPASPTLARLREDAISRMRERLAAPERTSDDWSIDWNARCRCGLCVTLRGFLADRARHTFDWPLVTSDRAHIHQKIDAAELPVTHQTRRTGRPYTLVLSKSAQMFTLEATARRQLQEALARLVAEAQCPAVSGEADDSLDLFRVGEAVSTADLAALGLSRRVFQPWIRSGLLEPTAKRGVYRAAKGLNAVVLDALVELG